MKNSLKFSEMSQTNPSAEAERSIDKRKILLSKEDIYAPLAAYAQPHKELKAAHLDDSLNYRESHVHNLIQDISETYLKGTTFAPGEAPIDIKKDVEPNIQARAITLVGSNLFANKDAKRGIKNKHKKPNFPAAMSGRKRKAVHKEKSEQFKMMNEATNNKKKIKNNNPQILTMRMDAIELIHRKWTQYFEKMSDLLEKRHSNKISMDDAFCLGIVELRGAKVEILTCTPHPKYVGQIGIVLDDLQNTWRICLIDSNSSSEETRQTTELNQAVNTLQSKNDRDVKVLKPLIQMRNEIIPKVGSTLSIVK